MKTIEAFFWSFLNLTHEFGLYEVQLSTPPLPKKKREKWKQTIVSHLSLFLLSPKPSWARHMANGCWRQAKAATSWKSNMDNWKICWGHLGRIFCGTESLYQLLCPIRPFLPLYPLHKFSKQNLGVAACGALTLPHIFFHPSSF